MTEQFLHYLFETRKLGKNFVTTDGEELEVKDFGLLNSNSGPDFLQAIVRYKETTWAGHIEFHKSSSDWLRHGHQHDSSYNNVIAHFVYTHDRDIYSGAYKLPTVELKHEVDKNEYEVYQRSMKSKKWVVCEDVNEMKLLISQELPIQLKKRISRKSQLLIEKLKDYQGDQRKVFLSSIFKAIGGKVNQSAFNELLEKFKWQHLAQLNYDPFRTQAYMHGLSGLLMQSTSNDDYVKMLKKEFTYQKQLFNLDELAKEMWKFSTFRPASHPTHRIAQVAYWLSQNPNISELQDLNKEQMSDFFSFKPHSFWASHYHFNRNTKNKSARFSEFSIQQMIINALVPFLNMKSILQDQPSLNKKAVNLLDDLPPEKNNIVQKWKKLGVEVNNAADSQALIELKNEWCSYKKCLNCAVGKSMLRK